MIPLPKRQVPARGINFNSYSINEINVVLSASKTFVCRCI